MIRVEPTLSKEDVHKVYYDDSVWDNVAPMLVKEDHEVFESGWYYLVLRDEDNELVGVCKYRDATKLLVEFHGGFTKKIQGSRSGEGMQAIMDWWKANTVYQKCMTFVPANAKAASRFFLRNEFSVDGAIAEGIRHKLLPVTLFILTKPLYD